VEYCLCHPTAQEKKEPTCKTGTLGTPASVTGNFFRRFSSDDFFLSVMTLEKLFFARRNYFGAALHLFGAWSHQKSARGVAGFYGIREWLLKMGRNGGEFMNNRTIRRKKELHYFSAD
jgi:hypothetical protein